MTELVTTLDDGCPQDGLRASTSVVSEHRSAGRRAPGARSGRCEPNGTRGAAIRRSPRRVAADAESRPPPPSPPSPRRRTSPLAAASAAAVATAFAAAVTAAATSQQYRCRRRRVGRSGPTAAITRRSGAREQAVHGVAAVLAVGDARVRGPPWYHGTIRATAHGQRRLGAGATARRPRGRPAPHGVRRRRRPLDIGLRGAVRGVEEARVGPPLGERLTGLPGRRTPARRGRPRGSW